MKANPTSILLFGHSEELLAMRQWVLETRGYRVVKATTFTELASAPDKPRVQLVLLCHTLSAEERDSVAVVAESRWPGVLCHAMAMDRSRAPSGILGRLMHTQEGPAQLVAMVTRLLESMPAADEGAAA
ncbi:MAG TPA: hypothetical protein VG714_08500 [Acidobacteriaceae bacterium]|nr:hypothetical protein [Acidobacteriaceae bacterium]